VLRLHTLKLGYRKISNATGIGKTQVAEYVCQSASNFDEVDGARSRHRSAIG
jgi:hypothetical protein